MWVRIFSIFFSILFLHFSLHILWYLQDGWPSASFLFTSITWNIAVPVYCNFHILMPPYCIFCVCVYIHSHYFPCMSKYLKSHRWWSMFKMWAFIFFFFRLYRLANIYCVGRMYADDWAHQKLFKCRSQSSTELSWLLRIWTNTTDFPYSRKCHKVSLLSYLCYICSLSVRQSFK